MYPRPLLYLLTSYLLSKCRLPVFALERPSRPLGRRWVLCDGNKFLFPPSLFSLSVLTPQLWLDCISSYAGTRSWVFQEKAAAKALSSNIIVRADTGTGKTFIAILLLKRLFALRPTCSDHTIAVFLTPTAALVDQQATAIEHSTTLRVKRFIGADGVDYWKRERWIDMLHAADVVVMTPQIWLNVLSNAYWSLKQVNLMVFDECHHASKKHPYAEIMRSQYHPAKKADPAAVPRILGMTASPIYSSKNPRKAIDDFESILDARILEVMKENPDEAAAIAPRASEELVEHMTTFLGDGLGQQHGALSQLRRLAPDIDSRAEDRLSKCFELFGLAGADVYLSDLANDSSVSDDLAQELGHAASRTLAADSNKLSPKMVALVGCLARFASKPHFHAILFVEQRHHASVLAKLIRRISSLGWIKPGFLVGHGDRGRIEGRNGSGRELGVENRQQEETVEKFRNGQINLLVATAVAEEGLDFQKPACNLVVRFDDIKTFTGYIQSRGRARAAEASFVVLAALGSEAALRYRKFVAMEPERAAMYADRPIEIDPDEPELDDTPVYRTRAGALLTFQTSNPLLAAFCSLMNRTDAYTPLQKPTYEVFECGGGFVAELTVPKIVALRRQVFPSEPLPRKKAACQAVAFEACRQLHLVGALDDYLQPVRDTTAVGAKDAYGREVDRSPSAKLLPVRTINPFGNVWTAETCWLHTLEINDETGSRRMGLLCGQRQAPLEDGEVFGRSGYRGTVRIVDAREYRWRDGQERDGRLRQLDDYNRAICLVLFNRNLPEDKFVALWAPLDRYGCVDFDSVEHAFAPLDAARATPDTLVVIPHRRPRRRIGRFYRARDDVNSSSPTHEIERDPPRQKEKVIAKYPEYYVYLKVVHDYHDLEADSAVPIVEIEPLLFSPHSLCERKDPSVRVPKGTRIFPSTMCRTTNIALATWDLLSIMPAVNRLVSSRTTAALAIERLQFPDVDLSRLNEALTTPSAGLGFDYEYLETLGDAALELATSVYLYLEYPTAEEGRLTALRSNSVDNRFLREKSLATAIGLASFVMPSPLRFSTFRPEATDEAILSDDGLFSTRRISRKILSDTVEAVLGAAVRTGGLEMAMEVGTKLDLCFGGTTPWSDRPSARKLLDVEPTKAGSGLSAVEEALGYEFKTHGQLLRQALTHRSCPDSNYCYEREEFLGDALLDYWCTIRLFPLAASTTPRFLSFRRAMLVNNSTLSLIATRKLSLHKSILHGSPLLQRAMDEAAEQAASIDWQDVVIGDSTWVWSPPKVLGDVVEALLAVVFVDSEFNLDVVCQVLDRLYADILPFFGSEKERRDPYSKLLMWKDAHACEFLKLTVVRPLSPFPTLAVPEPVYTSTITFHDRAITSQANASRTVSQQLASREALSMLENATLSSRCNCKERKEREKRARREEKEAQGGAVEMEEVEGPGKVDVFGEGESSQGTEGESLEESNEIEVEGVKEEVRLEDEDEQEDEEKETMEEDEVAELILPKRVREY
ncbi:hypothetical protein JCM10212_006144 [Sporobolomyces blumeae]